VAVALVAAGRVRPPGRRLKRRIALVIIIVAAVAAAFHLAQRLG
jgi:hypothetical protein